MDALEFIGCCIGASPGTCNKMDEIEKNFHLDVGEYDLPEEVVLEAVRNDPKHVGNRIIQWYFDMEIKYLCERYKDDGITDGLFDFYINGPDSGLLFNESEYENEEDLEAAIEEYISIHKKEE